MKANAPVMIHGRAFTDEEVARWCHGVIAHAAVSAYRRRARWQRDLLGHREDVRVTAADGPTVPDNPLATVEWQLVLRAALAPEAACVVHAVYFADCSQREAAARCGMSQATVHRLHRAALRTLREVIVR